MDQAATGLKVTARNYDLRPLDRGRRWVPSLVEATGTAGGIWLSMTIETDREGHSLVRRLELRDDGTPITSATLRLPIGRIVHTALAIVAMDREQLPGGGAAYSVGEAVSRDDIDATRPRRRAMDDDHFRQVAAIYRAALERGDGPTDSVGREMHAARSTAGRWVMLARQRTDPQTGRPFLGPAEPGRAGETPRDGDN